MTVPAQFVPRNYDVFAGLDVDKKSMAVIFTDHEQLMQSLRLPYSAAQLLNYVRKRFPGQRLAFVYEAGPTGFGLYDELVAAGHPCLVVAPPMVPTAPGKRVKTLSAAFGTNPPSNGIMKNCSFSRRKTFLFSEPFTKHFILCEFPQKQ